MGGGGRAVRILLRDLAIDVQNGDYRSLLIMWLAVAVIVALLLSKNLQIKKIDKKGELLFLYLFYKEIIIVSIAVFFTWLVFALPSYYL